VTFNPNGGAGVGYVVLAATVGNAQNAVPSDWPERTGYTFSGWRTAPSGGSAPVGADPASGQQFYAQWQLVPAADPSTVPAALANTGAEFTGALAAGVLAVLLGGGLMLVRRSHPMVRGSRPGA
jgi:uncharacterized repeat protein (TIGR02543 family)/LPXTG-motif cell wall-anchored protein